MLHPLSAVIGSEGGCVTKKSQSECLSQTAEKMALLILCVFLLLSLSLPRQSFTIVAQAGWSTMAQSPPMAFQVQVILLLQLPE